MRVISLVEDAEEIRDEESSQHDRRDEPRRNSLDEPVDLPGPSLDPAKGNKVGSGGEAAEPVIEYADKRIGSHVCLVRKSCWMARDPCYRTGMRKGKYIPIELRWRGDEANDASGDARMRLLLPMG
jgi:hypothetical protein